MIYAVVRIRGSVNVKPKIKKTLRLLRLNRVNHCVLVRDTPQYIGMLKKAKDYITWGEIEKNTLINLIRSRGRLMGDIKLTDDYIKENTDFNSIEEFAESLLKGDIEYKSLKNVKPIFRLHPPYKGYGGIKRPYSVGGALGYRGKDINTLLEKMI